MKLYQYVALAAVIALCACNSNNNNANNEGSSNVRLQMLKNIGRNMIIPEFAKLKTKVDSLAIAKDAFVSNVNETNLVVLQKSWDNAYSQYMRCSVFNFGPGKDIFDVFLVDEIGLFPVKTDSIEARIKSAKYTTNDFARFTRGFLALDYLLFDSAGVNANITSKYSNTNRLVYLDSLTKHLQREVNHVNKGWESYITIFENDASTATESSIGSFFNSFVLGYELIKNFKIQLPSGLRAGQTSADVKLTEGYYCGYSTKYLKISLNQIQTIWLGNASAKDTIGFDNYLMTIPGGDVLVANTKTSWKGVSDALNALPDDKSMANIIKNDFALISTLNTKLTNHTKYYKSEFSTKTGIAYTYNSGDGD